MPRSGIREIYDLAKSLPDVKSLGIGEPFFGTPSFIRRAAKIAIDRGLGKYTLNVGIPELRDAIARKLKNENGIRADPAKEIIVTAGATQAIFAIMNCLLGDGDEVLLPSPLFTAYQYAAQLAGGVPIEVETKEKDGYSLDFAELESKVTDRTKAFVINSPCNPTGVVFDRDSLERAAEFAKRNHIYIVSDEIYEKYLYEGAHHYSPASNPEFKDSTITVNGFSKTFAMTGWRLGYAVASEEIVSALTKFNMYNAVCANSIAQYAGVAALKARPLFFDPILKRYARLRKIMCNYLDEMELPYVSPKGAFYTFPDISSITKDSLSFSLKLLKEEHVATVPGSSFGIGGESHLRLSYSCEQRELVAALEKMKKFSKNYRS